MDGFSGASRICTPKGSTFWRGAAPARPLQASVSSIACATTCRAAGGRTCRLFGSLRRSLRSSSRRDTRTSHLANAAFFIVRGTIEPRKNHLLLLRVWRRLIERFGQDAPKLVVIGKRGWNNKEVVSTLENQALRFALFCRAVLEASKKLGVPQVFHVHDWQAALIPVYLRTVFASDTLLSRAGVVLTIHNAGYQGAFPPEDHGATALSMRRFLPWISWSSSINSTSSRAVWSTRTC